VPRCEPGPISGLVVRCTDYGRITRQSIGGGAHRGRPPVCDAGRCVFSNEVRSVPSVRPHVAHEPDRGIRPAEEVELVGVEFDPSQAQLDDRLRRVQDESNAQLPVREQLLDGHSNSGS
jgi:hypothetical protein